MEELTSDWIGKLAEQMRKENEKYKDVEQLLFITPEAAKLNNLEHNQLLKNGTIRVFVWLEAA